MGKPADGRGNTGSTDGIKAGGATPGTNATFAKRIRLQPMALGRNTAQKICQKIFPARNVLWHRKQLPNSLRRVDAMWLWARPDACYGGWDYCCFHQHLFCGRNGAPMAMMIL